LCACRVRSAGYAKGWGTGWARRTVARGAQAEVRSQRHLGTRERVELARALAGDTHQVHAQHVRQIERGSLRLQRRRELPSQRTAARPLVCVEVGEEKPLLLAPVGVACNRRL
jgi:hypothetical protein